jgi:succinate dehydrogenase / fumarate reductase flavoprotein subunit/fumarate reductase flavoprotein subunit
VPTEATVDPDVLTTDVCIVGSGGAGLMCALHLADRAPNCDITLVSKGIVGKSGCTRMVQGGFNAVLDPADSLEGHFLDTLAGGYWINDQELAWTLVTDAPKVITELETRVGCFFDRSPDGRIHQKAFAGQTFDRTVHRGDLTGLEIMGRLRDQMFRLGLRELEDVRALDLLVDDGDVVGLAALDIRTGRPLVIACRLVVLTTGGAATMYRLATPAREKTGDGIAMCCRAGLELRDMEMLQFHPTGLLAGDSRLTGALLEEGLRGAGAILVNALGERFMDRYDPARMERSTRDVVSRASYTEIVEGRGTPAGGVLIDIASVLGPDEVRRRFPGMVERTRQLGQDLSTGPVEVSPVAHFQMGGVVIDADCRTSLPGLLVAGEDAGGVHGANRLGGNGVAESTVFGARAGDVAAELVWDRPVTSPPAALVDAVMARTFRALRASEGEHPMDVSRELKTLMWQHAGVVRDHAGLSTAAEHLEQLAERSRRTRAPGPPAMNPSWQEAIDLENQIVAARCLVASALERTESRGAHFRRDHPRTDDPAWFSSVRVRAADDGSLQCWTVPVAFSRRQPPGATPSLLAGRS